MKKQTEYKMKKIASIIVGLLMVTFSFGQTQNKKDFDKSLMVQLDTIQKLDQHYRLQMSETEKKYGAQSEEFITLLLQIEETDSINLIDVEKILDDHGWLGADVIGDQGNKTLFLVIQHSDLETQLKYLPMMREAVQLGNARKIDFALFEDRLLMRQGKRQIYGSQISKDYDTGEIYIWPLIEPEKVNERRAEIGLGPIEDYVERVGIAWDVEKHIERTKRIESKKEESNPPNIIIFLVDDMGLMDTSVPFITDTNGNPVRYPLNDFYQTPNMEMLAEQGVLFTNFYAHSVCSPTRVSLLTGQNSARHGVTTWIKSESNNRSEFGPSNWNWKGLSKESVTLPRLLQQEGYKTIHVGKAHFGPFNSEGEDPLNLGFDVNIAGSSIGQPGSYYGKDGYGHISGNKERAVPGLEKYHGKDIFLTEALTLEAISAISEAKNEGKPFFLNMAHYAVHTPFQSDLRFANHYKNSGQSEKAQTYATLIEGVDKSLGDIIQHVKNIGLGENTLLLFLGDNGSDAPLPIENNYSSSTPLKGKKGNHWEGGMRVPFIASWLVPNDNIVNQQKTPIARNTIQQQMGSVMDIFSTLCQVVNINAPEEHIIDGFTLQDQLNGQKNVKRDEQFLNHFPHSHRSSYFTSFVRFDWKVIYHFQVEGAPLYELFNLKEDPFETNNLADKNPEQLKIMLKELSDEMNSKKALYPEKEKQSLELIMPR